MNDNFIPFGSPVLVSWIDAETVGDSGWTDLDEARESSQSPPPIMKTMGFVLCDCITHVAITDSLGAVECGHVTKIPRSMIQGVIRY